MRTITTRRKILVVLLGSLLAYLLQACVMGYLTIGGVSGSVLFAFLAVIIVSCGKKSAFCASGIIGMLMESMLASVNALYIICYPVITMLWAQAFADMSDRQREKLATLHPKRRQEDLPALVRILLSAACMTLTMNGIELGYVYLSGIALTAGHFGRMLLNVAYTTGLSFVLTVPVRALLGMYKKPKPAFKGGEVM